MKADVTLKWFNDCQFAQAYRFSVSLVSIVDPNIIF
jgi:hypothetical protein